MGIVKKKLSYSLQIILLSLILINCAGDKFNNKYGGLEENSTIEKNSFDDEANKKRLLEERLREKTLASVRESEQKEIKDHYNPKENKLRLGSILFDKGDWDAIKLEVVKKFIEEHTNLRTLDFSCKMNFNSMSTLVPLLEKLTQLERLELSDYKHDSQVTAILVSSLEKWKRLKELDLSSNKLDAQALEILAPSLEKLKRLKKLDLSFNKLDAQALEILAPSLEKLTQLERLTLAHNDLDAQSMQILEPFLAKLTNLEILDLYGNKLDYQALEILAQLVDKLDSLIMLDVSFNNKRAMDTKTKNSQAITSLAKVLGKCQKKLKSLILSWGDMDPQAIMTLAQSLASLEKLIALGVSNTKLDLQMLATVLENRKNLKNLKLYRNIIQSKGLKTSDSSLEKFKNLNLISLDLSDNEIDISSLGSLATIIESMTSLKTLNLSRNKLDFRAMQLLAPSLEKLENLKTLNLSTNGLDAQSMQILEPFLAKLTNLETLDLSNNNLDFQSLEALVPLLKNLKNLKILDLSENIFSTKDKEKLERLTNLKGKIRI